MCPYTVHHNGSNSCNLPCCSPEKSLETVVQYNEGYGSEDEERCPYTVHHNGSNSCNLPCCSPEESLKTVVQYNEGYGSEDEERCPYTVHHNGSPVTTYRAVALKNL